MKQNSTPCCVVCGATMGRGAVSDQSTPSCQAVACRMVMSRRAEMGEPGFRHYLQTQARHRQFQADLARAAAQRKLAEVDQNAAAWQHLRARLPAGLTPEPLRLLLPSGPRRASRPAAQRRARYREHLLKIVGEAQGLTDSAADPAGTPATARASAMPGQLCALCGGGCCTKGGDQAYLSAATMRRFMQAHPDLTPDQVVSAYLERVAGQTQSGSCINHTGQGCSLPTDMRSHICNRFSCESLARLQAAQRLPDAVHAVLIVRRKQDHWWRNEPVVDNAIIALAVLGETQLTRIAPSALKRLRQADEAPV